MGLALSEHAYFEIGVYQFVRSVLTPSLHLDLHCLILHALFKIRFPQTILLGFVCSIERGPYSALVGAANVKSQGCVALALHPNSKY